jgi:hypothetical protein
VSDALEKWLTERAEALDSLDAIHGKITGRRRGRKYDTKLIRVRGDYMKISVQLDEADDTIDRFVRTDSLVPA